MIRPLDGWNESFTAASLVHLTPKFSCKHSITIAAKPHPKSACLLQRSLGSILQHLRRIPSDGQAGVPVPSFEKGRDTSPRIYPLPTRRLWRMVPHRMRRRHSAHSRLWGFAQFANEPAYDGVKALIWQIPHSI